MVRALMEHPFLCSEVTSGCGVTYDMNPEAQRWDEE